MYASFKVRQVSTSPGSQSAPLHNSPHPLPVVFRINDTLLTFLRSQRAEALLLQDDSRIAQLDEATRGVEALGEAGCHTVIQVLVRFINQSVHNNRRMEPRSGLCEPKIFRWWTRSLKFGFRFHKHSF